MSATRPILFATAEMAPLARVGGLAEAAAGLVAQLRIDGWSPHVVLPDYDPTVELADEVVDHVPVPEWAGGEATVRHGRHRELARVSLVTTAGIARPHPYVDADGAGWPDNTARFLGFSAAVAAIADRTDPAVVHLNDWHTATVPAFAAVDRPTVLTIHTLAYQGVTEAAWLDRLPRHADAYAWYDACNPLVGAIRLADRLIAVSPNYAREIVTPQHGAGHDRELAARGGALVGIRNGIDVAQWNPATDPHIAANYRPTTVARHKKHCRTALLARVGLTAAAGEPVFGVVSRLVDQKGIDVLAECVPYLAAMRARLVVLGSGDRALADRLNALAARYPDRVSFHDGYDNELAHQIFAGSDLFVMPSRFEPCGLAQMQAMAYGTLPVVTDVGGLHDTVSDADAHPDTGTGIVVAAPTVVDLVDGLHRGAALWRDTPRRTRARRNGMTTDWSWADPAAAHRRIYGELAG